MEEQIRKLNVEYGFDLSEDEIKVIVRQVQETKRLFLFSFATRLDSIQASFSSISGGLRSLTQL
jgi:hypothetical protein